jgi:CHAT domain-containing protein
LARSTWIDELQAFLAYTLVLQDRPLEAEVEARRAVLGALANRGRYSLHTAHVLRSLVEAVGAQGRYVEAETLARAVLEICEKTGASQESVIVAGSRSALVAALAFQGRYREALAEYEKNRAALAANPEDTRRFISANTGYALPLIHTGQPDEALKILKTALDQSTSLLGERHPRVALIRGQMGLAYLRKADHRRALSEFRAAAALVSVFSSDAEDGGSQRTSNLHRIREVLEGYLQLLSDIRGTPLEREARIDAAAEGFRVAGVLQASSVDRALNASAIRAAAHSPILSDLVRREQDATMQLAALRGLLGNVLASGEQNSERIEADLRSRIAALDNARRALAQQIQKDFPRYATLVAPSAPSIESVREVLRDGEALISLVLLPTRTLVWAVAKTGDLEFGTSPLGRRELRGLVDKLRAALDPGARTVGDIPEFDVVTSHVLFRAVLEPVRGAWEHARTLLVVPHGSLGQIPFSLLVTKQVPSEPERGALFSNYGRIPWLIRTHAVVSVPSTAALVTLRTLPPPDLNRRPFIGFGDPYFSEQQAREAARERAPVDVALLTGRNLPITLRDLKIQSLPSRKLAILPRLPDTADEIRSIASAVNADPARDVFLGERANEQQVKTLDLSTYRVIAFATHGLVPGDLDGLTQPALALSAPEVAKVAGDGLLMMEEILALRLNADWVVLSACNTASGSGAGSEAISGLGRAFFYAGARALLVSYWPVETTSARALTTDVFKRQRTDSGLSRATALKQAMNALIDGPGFVDPKTNRVVFSYAHPIFWAPFALVGDGG